MANRIIRGFSRLGIGAAVVTAICGVGVTAIVAVDQYSQAQSNALLAAKQRAFKTGPSGERVPANVFDQFDNPPPPGFVIDRPGMFDDLIPGTPSNTLGTDAIRKLDVAMEPGKWYEITNGSATFRIQKISGFTDEEVGLRSPARSRVASAAVAKSASISLGITAMLALAVFGFFRGLGWVVAGFARD